jgi:hypothetical protein
MPRLMRSTRVLHGMLTPRPYSAGCQRRMSKLRGRNWDAV